MICPDDRCVQNNSFELHKICINDCVNEENVGKIFAIHRFYLYDSGHGSVAERFNAPVLKTDEGASPP